ncbi:MAG: YggS family pyridoxal phosphate-dependent enzyme [Chloroflexi bacterium]|nr:YggS family pyridoxal phosphate-dependent enzyme [Chloroflexota bacterium]
MKRQTVAERLEQVRERMDAACERSGRSPKEITLIAVTKGFPPDVVREAIAAGIADIGENRVQEAQAKRSELSDLPARVSHHMLGHLQTNKVRAVLDLFDIIHSVDSLHLAEAISRRASTPFPVFLEVNAAAEPSKFGFAPEALPDEFNTISTFPNLDVRGLMTVAPITEDTESVRPVFRQLRDCADGLGLSELSMGMTNDFEVAIEEGATHVRIGRALFGERSLP